MLIRLIVQNENVPAREQPLGLYVVRRYIVQVKLLIDRKKILLEILHLEVKISTLRKNPTYRKNKHYLNLLEGSRFGSSMMSIPSPDKPSIMLRVKKNSREMKEIRSKYGVSQAKFNLQMDDLHNQKARLQEQLFNNK